MNNIMSKDKPESINLDLRDKRLLYQLDLNARQSNSQIGKRTHLNKNTVSYRIDRLKEKGIITGFYTEINMYKLGYKTFRIFIRFQDLTKDGEKDIINHFANDPKVTWILSVEGAYDLILGVMVKTNSEFYEFKEDLLYRYSKYIQNISYSIYVRMYQYKKDYLLDLKRRELNFKIMGGEDITKIDEIDDKILQILAVNARMPLFDIAAKLKISPKVVVYRIKQLMKKEIIQSFRVMLNNELLGYKWYKIHFWLKNFNKEQKEELERFVRTNPNVIFTNDTIGGADFEPELHVKNEDELRNFINTIRENFPSIIKDYEILHYYKIHKNLNYFPVK